jgi:dTDP-4-amino-4,6-dideoxygalactose transaminase
VEAFESAAARTLGVEYALAVSSGSMALAAGLAALGVGRGDEVIVPAYTWISSAAAVALLGAVPVIAEVDDALTLDAADVERRITPRTKVILVVHMRGGAADMDALTALADRTGLRILEDTAQAFGASYKGRRLGTIGDVGIFSLQFNKILTAGEGGLVVSNDRSAYERALLFHDVAASMRSSLNDAHTFVAVTGRMSELQGAVAGVQLQRLEGILADMRASFEAIKSNVAEAAAAAGITFRHQWDPQGDADLALISYLPDASRADEVVRALEAEGIPASRLFDPATPDYHVAHHWQPLIAQRSWSAVTPWTDGQDHPSIDSSSCPRTHELLERAVQIDISPDLTEAQVEQVSRGLQKVFGSLKAAE